MSLLLLGGERGRQELSLEPTLDEVEESEILRALLSKMGGESEYLPPLF